MVRRVGSAVALLFLLAGPAAAQNPRGALAGVVQDASGARVASPTVVVRAADSAVERQSTGDKQGGFRIDDLLPGTYQMTVRAPGFADAKSEVVVAVSSLREVTVTLQRATQATVTVSGRTSSISTQPLDTMTATQQGVVSADDLRTIPLAHRTFANISFMVPGTEPVEPSDPTKARITAVSFGGSSGLNVELSVDGGDNSDDYIGGFLQNFSPDVIQEFAVRTALSDADTGRTTGGSVVITTKSGSNQRHGDLSFDERGRR